MIAGDIVTVYEFPQTRESPEGKVRLLAEIWGPNADGLSYWLVKFVEENGEKCVEEEELEVERWIL